MEWFLKFLFVLSLLYAALIVGVISKIFVCLVFFFPNKSGFANNANNYLRQFFLICSASSKFIAQQPASQHNQLFSFFLHSQHYAFSSYLFGWATNANAKRQVLLAQLTKYLAKLPDQLMKCKFVFSKTFYSSHSQPCIRTYRWWALLLQLFLFSRCFLVFFRRCSLINKQWLGTPYFSLS